MLFYLTMFAKVIYNFFDFFSFKKTPVLEEDSPIINMEEGKKTTEEDAVPIV